MIRKATIGDVKKIHKLLDEYGRDVVIPRSLSELYEHLRDFYVYIEVGEVVGTCALHISWEDLAEIRSIVVADDHKSKGAGKALVEECLKEAMLLGIQKIFILRRPPGYGDMYFGIIIMMKHFIWIILQLKKNHLIPDSIR